MLLHPNTLRVAKAASTDTSRVVLQGVYITPDGGGVATDGHLLVKFTPKDIPDGKDYPVIEGVKADDDGAKLKPFTLPSEAAAEILKAIPKKRTTLPILGNIALDVVETNNNGAAVMGVTDLENPRIFKSKKMEGTYPDYEKVIPSGKKPVLEIGLGIDVMLKTLNTLKALYSEQKLQGLRFKFYGSDKPFRIEGKADSGDVLAVVMPMKLDSMPNLEENGTNEAEQKTVKESTKKEKPASVKYPIQPVKKLNR